MRATTLCLLVLPLLGCSSSHPEPGADSGRPIDAAPTGDAGPACAETVMGSCGPGLGCLGCPSGPITEHYLCTTPCTSDTDCLDATRPHCNIDPSGGVNGLCTTVAYTCTWGARCASPDTLIATPLGERPIADLREGDLVYSADHGMLTAVHLRFVMQTPAFDHRVVRVTLRTGRVLEISPGHPTADGRTFGDLRAGDLLDGVGVATAELVPYLHAFTYDIMPDSETGTYVAGGALIGSTLGP